MKFLSVAFLSLFAFGLFSETVSAQDPFARRMGGLQTNEVTSESKQEIEDLLNDLIRYTVNLDLDLVAEKFTPEDHKRVKDSLGRDFAELNLLVNEFMEKWAEKYYGGDFTQDLSSTSMPYEIVAGDKKKTAIAKLIRGVDLDSVAFKMIDQGDITTRWKIDIDDKIDGVMLKKQVAKAFKAILKRRAKWPSNQEEGVRDVGRYIFYAISGKL